MVSSAIASKKIFFPIIARFVKLCVSETEKDLRSECERETIVTFSRGGNMFHDLLYPNGLLYILIKLTVLALAVLLWFMVVSAPAV